MQTKLEDLNPKIPLEGLQEALRKIRLISHPTLIENNRAFHRLLVEGVDVEFRNRDGQIVHDKVWLIDFANSEANEFLARKKPRKRFWNRPNYSAVIGQQDDHEESSYFLSVSRYVSVAWFCSCISRPDDMPATAESPAQNHGLPPLVTETPRLPAVQRESGLRVSFR